MHLPAPCQTCANRTGVHLASTSSKCQLPALAVGVPSTSIPQHSCSWLKYWLRGVFLSLLLILFHYIWHLSHMEMIWLEVRRFLHVFTTGIPTRRAGTQVHSCILFMFCPHAQAQSWYLVNMCWIKARKCILSTS